MARRELDCPGVDEPSGLIFVLGCPFEKQAPDDGASHRTWQLTWMERWTRMEEMVGPDDVADLMSQADTIQMNHRLVQRPHGLGRGCFDERGICPVVHARVGLSGGLA